MKNAYFYSHDPVLTLIYDRNEAIDLFGEDSIEEFGSELPEELIARFKKNWDEFWKIQAELNLIKNGPPEPERDGTGRIIKKRTGGKMRAEKVLELLKTSHYRVIFAAGQKNFTPGSNFIFIVLPDKETANLSRWKKKGGMRWQKDFLQSLTRFVRSRFPEFKKVKIYDLIGVMDGCNDGDGIIYLENRIAGENDRIWVIYPEDKPGLEITEIEF